MFFGVFVLSVSLSESQQDESCKQISVTFGVKVQSLVREAPELTLSGVIIYSIS